MIASRRISKFHCQLGLLQFKRISQQKCLSNRLHTTKTNEITNLTKNYQLAFIAEKECRHFSTSTYFFARTEVMKGQGDHNLNLEYDDLVKAQRDESVLIIDVREDEEIKETGKLPGSVHIPMGQVADVFKNMSEKEFQEKFQKPKPTKDTKLIFSCRSGRRSAVIQEEILKLGYQKSYNYIGGWLDWESKQKSKV